MLFFFFFIRGISSIKSNIGVLWAVDIAYSTCNGRPYLPEVLLVTHGGGILQFIHFYYSYHLNTSECIHFVKRNFLLITLEINEKYPVKNAIQLQIKKIVK